MRLSTGGSTSMARVSFMVCGSGRRTRTTLKSTVVPGSPWSSRPAYASGISRVPIPLMLSIMSPVENPALAAGEPGTVPTTPT